MVLDFGGGSESSTDDDGGGGGDVGIDMRRLLSFSSQAGGAGGPNLSRQLRTHLRLLQADLQYLKVPRGSLSWSLIETQSVRNALIRFPLIPGSGDEVQRAATHTRRDRHRLR